VPVTREQVVQTAIRLLDEVGLDGLTVRRLAAELGVQAPALYWHVRNKRELLDLMAEQIAAAAVPAWLQEPAPGQPWWDWLAERSRAMRGALLLHRDGARVVAGNRPTPDALPHIERLLGVLHQAGFPSYEALQAVLALGAYVGGSALEAQAEAARPTDRPQRLATIAEAVQNREQFPRLGTAFEEMRRGPDDEFEYGLRRLIDGLRARHAHLTGAEQPVTSSPTE
jgi:TetR/AcrR family transcriptional regulator, tetracycline repressor protein